MTHSSTGYTPSGAACSSVITEALPPFLTGSALTGSASTSAPAGCGSARHRRSFWQLLTEATPVVPLLPEPDCASPTQLCRLGVKQLGCQTSCKPLVCDRRVGSVPLGLGP